VRVLEGLQRELEASRRTVSAHVAS
jgi:hypothetical protein